MNTITAPKSSALNKLEGLTLSAGLKGLPTFTTLALLLKLSGGGHFLDHAAIIVVTASIAYALFTGPILPKPFKRNWEPVFFDASLSFSDKILRWRAQPAASLQLLINAVMLSVLGLQMLSLG